MSRNEDRPLMAGGGTGSTRGAIPFRLSAIFCLAGVAAIAGALRLAPQDMPRFWHAWLVSWLFFLSLALGGLFFVLLHFVTRAGWSVVVRRIAEQVMATLPLMAILWLPIALALGDLFPWARGDASVADPILRHRHPYLNGGFFLGRGLLYLATWSALAWWFRRESVRQDRAGDVAATRRLQTASAPALVVFGLTLTFASLDWIMSLDAHWYSTIFGVYVFSGCAVGIVAFLIVLSVWLERAGPLRGIITAEHLHDLGKLLFAFTVFWAYIAFSQFLLIWYAALPEESGWFARRMQGGWREVSLTLAAGHFVLPFFFLLSRAVKRRRATLLAAAVWLLAMHYLDLYWLVMPELPSARPLPRLVDGLTLAGIGGLFMAGMGLSMRGAAAVPLGDPRLAESLGFEDV